MVEVADPWKPEPPAQAREIFAGWIVELTIFNCGGYELC
jgi:hypothetical protein